MRLAAALVLLALTLTGCESNIERSARLAKLVHHQTPAKAGLVITHQNPNVKVLATTVLHDENGTAAVVRLRDDASQPLRDVPVAITLHSTNGSTLYQNDTAGLGSALVSAPLLLPGKQFDWIDDQIQAAGGPGALSVRVGEAAAIRGKLPELVVKGVHLAEESASGPSAEGTLVNRSGLAQQELVVFAVGTRSGRIVAAGRAVLPDAPAHSTTPFQVFFIGNPKGAKLQLSAPPTTLG